MFFDGGSFFLFYPRTDDRIQAMDNELFEAGAPLDLMLRGFHRDVVKEMTGVDIGYNGASLRRQAKGVDRHVYKVNHVLSRVAVSVIDEVLAEYAGGASKETTLAGLGLSGTNIVKLKQLFADIDYGVEFQRADTARRSHQMSEGMTATHGVDNPFKLDKFQSKAGDTRERRYGGRYTLAEGSSLAQGARESFAEKMADADFAEDYYARRTETLRRNPDILISRDKKMKDTSIERYGFPSYSQLPEVRKSRSDFMLKNSEMITEKSRLTSLLKYDVPNPSMLESRRKQQSVRMRDKVHQENLRLKRKQNGTFATSDTEVILHSLLVDAFGENDVVRQYSDRERYPFSCDFYIPSRDLFIELNGTWTHGGRWYEGSGADQQQVDKWKKKDTAYFDNALHNWMVRDVAKREMARTHNLNYVVFWDGSAALTDARLWIAMGCPDGADWQGMYSWLPQRTLDVSGFVFPKVGDLSEFMKRPVLRQAVKAANAETFYAREIEIWNNNTPVRSSHWGTPQARLYANRYKYLGKLPEQLSDAELFRGMGISGVLRSYSTFDAAAMKQVLGDHNSRCVYDPCAGWGERMLTCAALGVGYTGVDINPAVVEGHRQLAETYGLIQQSTRVGDAAVTDMRNGSHDTVFTCPPYGDTEIYTEQGAENLDEQGFLVWWSQVVEMAVSSSTEVFAYQINQAWKDRMNDCVLSHGWVLFDQVALGVTASHMQRKKKGRNKGKFTRREFEEVQVFVRA